MQSPPLAICVLLLGLFGASHAAQWADCSAQSDGFVPYNGTEGPYGPTLNYTAEWKGSPLVVIYPSKATPAPAPLIVFMHGSTGDIKMYERNLRTYVSYGFVVIFPYIKSPSQDHNPLTTNTDGEYILRGIEYANTTVLTNSSSPIFGKVDLSSIVISGHSMGASCSITGSLRTLHEDGGPDPRVPKDSIKLVVTQHPGICGPFGPPPWPNTWLMSDLNKVVSSYPTLFTTATNDGAFWPAPHTAEHELGCFNGALPENGTYHPTTFVQFSATACDEDGDFPPWTDSGHDCPFKTGIESPWVLTAIKLYAHQGGSMSSQCAKMLYGQGADAMVHDTHVEKYVARGWPQV